MPELRCKVHLKMWSLPDVATGMKTIQSSTSYKDKTSRSTTIESGFPVSPDWSGCRYHRHLQSEKDPWWAVKIITRLTVNKVFIMARRHCRYTHYQRLQKIHSSYK